jgi:hypothetical protein
MDQRIIRIYFWILQLKMALIGFNDIVNGCYWGSFK